jgi:hypothetical protein
LRHQALELGNSFYALARELWHRRKHGYVRRFIWRLHDSFQALVGNSVVATTCGRAMTSGVAGLSAVAIPT